MRKKTHVPKIRSPRSCEICDAPLRMNYKSNERVCGQPKIPNSSQSVCQQLLARKTGSTSSRQDTTGRKCKICKCVMDYMYNASQKYCKRPLHIRKYFVDPKTECEKIAQKLAEKTWQDNNKGNKPVKPGEYIPMPKRKIVLTKRRCLGVLGNEELGEHYFMSQGPSNRQCERCLIAASQRKLTYAKHQDGLKGLEFLSEEGGY